MDSIPDIVDLVLWFLALLSVLVWTIGGAKFVAFHLAGRRNAGFKQQFDSSLRGARVALKEESADSPLARMYRAGQDELHSWKQSAVANLETRRELLMHVLRQQAHLERSRMENGLGLLASIGSTAPFIGLFGTVWGIMHALKGIAASGSAGLDVVAGPIGEALIATAIGISTAVPAVLAYNHLLRKLKVSMAEMENFASAFQYAALKSGDLKD